MEELISFFANLCDYYGDSLGKKAIRSEIVQYRNRWPERSFAVERTIGFQWIDKPRLAQIVVRFVYRVSNGKKRASGKADLTLRFDDPNGDCGIAYVREKRVKR